MAVVAPKKRVHKEVTLELKYKGKLKCGQRTNPG